MKKYIVTILVSLLCINAFAQSDTIIFLVDENETVNIGKMVSYLEDNGGKLTIAQVSSPEWQAKFVKSDMPTLNFGLTSDAFYWIEINIQNQTYYKDWVVELPYPMFEFADWYVKNKGSWILQKDGFSVPQAQRGMQSRYPAIHFAMSQDSAQTVYLRIKANTLACPLHVQSLKTYHSQHRFRDISFGVIQGIITLILGICLFFYLSYKQASYLVFSAVTISILVFSTFYDGYWTAGFANQQSQINFICFTTYAVVFFKVRSSFPTIFNVFKWLLGYITFSFILSWFVSVNFAAILGQINYAFVLLPFIITIAIRALRQGNKEAKLYLLGITAQFLFILVEVVFVNSGLNRPFINFMHFGFFAEILIFAFALVRQAVEEQNELKKAKEIAQKETLEQVKENARLVEEQNQILAKKIEEKTKDLQVKNEALQTSEEELRQNMEELESNQEELKAQKEQLEIAFEELNRQNTKVNDSIRYAQRIQNAILPHEDVLANAFSEHFVIFKPKDVVSGDFYWYLEIENKKFIAVVDCTGHGVPGAFMSMIGNTLLYEIINAKGIFETNLILEELHLGIVSSLNSKDARMEDGMDIAICCIENEENGKVKVQYSGAKRPLYYFSKQELIEIQADRKSIGQASSLKISYTLKEISLQAGDTLYMTTDGWADTINPERKRFGSQQFKEMLLQGANLHLKAQKEVFRHILEDYEQGTEQRDDVLLVGVKV